METREYFEKVMQDYNQNRNGRSLRKYSCVPLVASDMVERQSMHGKMTEMRGRLERDKITPDEWRQWYAGYRARLDEIRGAVSRMREELSRRDADLERQKRVLENQTYRDFLV